MNESTMKAGITIWALAAHIATHSKSVPISFCNRWIFALWEPKKSCPTTYTKVSLWRKMASSRPYFKEKTVWIHHI
jgi:hypothetical protein